MQSGQPQRIKAIFDSFLDRRCNGFDNVCRNHAIASAFSYMKIIEKWGSGIPRIFEDFSGYGLKSPELIDSDGDFRVNMYRMSNAPDKKVPIKSADKKMPIKGANKKMIDKKLIIDYLKINSVAKTSEISEFIGTGVRRARVILGEMVADGIIISEGNNKNRVYLLK